MVLLADEMVLQDINGAHEPLYALCSCIQIESSRLNCSYLWQQFHELNVRWAICTDVIYLRWAKHKHDNSWKWKWHWRWGFINRLWVLTCRWLLYGNGRNGFILDEIDYACLFNWIWRMIALAVTFEVFVSVFSSFPKKSHFGFGMFCKRHFSILKIEAHQHCRDKDPWSWIKYNKLMWNWHYHW